MMEYPPKVLWSNTVGKVNEMGFRIAAPSSLIEIPAVNVNLTTESLEVECQGYQDRPPHESFNHLRTPFLPWSWSTCEEPEESRLAFVMSQDYDVWSERLRAHRKKEPSKMDVVYWIFTCCNNGLKLSDRDKL